MDLQTQILKIQLTPEPAGKDGAQGPSGPAGEDGPPRQTDDAVIAKCNSGGLNWQCSGTFANVLPFVPRVKL